MTGFIKKKKYNLLSELLNNAFVFYQGIQKIRQNKTKTIKITLFSFLNLLKTVYINFLLLIKNILYSIFIFSIRIPTILLSIFKLPKFLKKQVHIKYFDFIFNLYLYNLKNLFKKRNTILELTTKSIKRSNKKKVYKKKLMNYIATVHKIKFTKNGKRYFMRGVTARRKRDKQLQNKSLIFSKFLYKYYFIENAFYRAENKISYNILHILSKVEYILHNLNKIINYFKNYKKLNFIRHISNLYLDKFRNIISSINNRSVLLKLFRKIDESFYELFVKRIYSAIHKRQKKRYIKHFINLSIFKLFIISYYSFKMILILNIIFNNKMVSFISNKLELIFSLQGLFNEYRRYFNIS